MPNTADPANALLLALSDDELARYGEIARDQAEAELAGWWLQGALALAALFVLGLALDKWGVAEFSALPTEVTGFGTGVMLALALSVALAYRPYRRVRNWTLWNRHCKAVRDEQERRNSAATGVRVDVAR